MQPSDCIKISQQLKKDHAGVGTVISSLPVSVWGNRVSIYASRDIIYQEGLS